MDNAGYARQRLHAMDSEILVILPRPQGAAAAAVGELFSQWEMALSRFDSGSELSRLNAAAGDR